MLEYCVIAHIFCLSGCVIFAEIMDQFLRRLLDIKENIEDVMHKLKVRYSTSIDFLL